MQLNLFLIASRIEVFGGAQRKVCISAHSESLEEAVIGYFAQSEDLKPSHLQHQGQNSLMSYMAREHLTLSPKGPSGCCGDKSRRRSNIEQCGNYQQIFGFSE